MCSPFHFNQAWAATSKGIKCRPKWRKQKDTCAANRKSKSTKFPYLDTSQISFSRCRDHNFLTKSIMYSKQSGGKGIADDTSLTLSQQVWFLTLFWVPTKSEISTLKLHPNYSYSFPINRVHFSLQWGSLTTIEILQKTSFISLKNRVFRWNVWAIFNTTKAFKHLPWTFPELTEFIEEAETPSPKLPIYVGTTNLFR